MGSFHSEKIKVRVLAEVTIIFWKPRYIVVAPNHPNYRASLYCIPFLRRRDYVKAWKNFRRKLWQGKLIDIGYCNRLAERSGIIEIHTLGRLDLGEKPIEVIHEKWSLVARKGELK